MFSLPSVPVTVFSLAMEIGAASAPPRSSSASSRASFAVRPVVWKRLPNTPWMVATLMTFSSLISRVTACRRPSTVSRRFSMNTTAMGLPRLARVVRSISSPPALSSVTSTCGPCCPVVVVAFTSWSPVTMMSRFSSTLPT